MRRLKPRNRERRRVNELTSVAGMICAGGPLHGTAIRTTIPVMKRITFLAAVALALALHAAPTRAGEPFLLPFFPTPLAPHQPPLAFGMTPEEVAGALETTLAHVGGTRANEIFVATLPGGALFPRGDRLYLKFRNGRLSGWKGDWAIAWVGP